MTNTLPAENLTRFDGYRVQAVVETTAPDGIERGYQAFPKLAEAASEVARVYDRKVVDGVEGQRIIWSVYGVRRDIAEHIGDRPNEAEAFALLFAVSGITGVSGEINYPLLRSWVVVYAHRFGSDSWIVTYPEEPGGRQLLRCLRINYEPEREETISVHPVEQVVSLDWQDGDSEPLEGSD